MSNGNILQLFNNYCFSAQRSKTYVGMLCAKDAKFYARLKGGGSCTMSTYSKVLQYFSDHWPLDLLWPLDIPRPDPAPDSPAVQAMAERFNLNQTQVKSDDPLTRLNAKDHIADPKAFCKAISFGCAVQRTSFDQVVRQYRDGGARATHTPRAGSAAATILEQLVAAGDVRFTARIERKARHLELAKKMGLVA